MVDKSVLIYCQELQAGINVLDIDHLLITGAGWVGHWASQPSRGFSFELVDF